jgi:transposase
LDESGFMLQPTVRRTWAPSGQTPVLVESARHDRISAIGALSISPQRRWMDFSFQLHPRTIDTSLLIPFLRALHHHFRHRVVLVWDNLRVHFKTAKYFSVKHPNWFRFEYLPPYCPELNPVEGVWSYVKYGRLPNFAADSVTHLRQEAADSLSSLRRNQNLLPAFLEHTKLQL